MSILGSRSCPGSDEAPCVSEMTMILTDVVFGDMLMRPGGVDGGPAGGSCRICSYEEDELTRVIVQLC